MRLLHISDLHAGKRLYERINRNEDLIYALEQVYDICKGEKVEILLIAGDIFDKRNPDFESQSLMLDFLTRINSLGTHTLLIAGNHDSYDFMKIYSNLRKLSNIHAFDRPKKNIEEAIFDYKGLRVACLPYPDERVLTELGEDKERSYAEKVSQYMKALAKKVEEVPYGILLAHLTVDKAKLAGSELPYSVMPSYAVRADTIPEVFKYVALGHIHRYQRIENAVPKVYYSGSLYQIDFSEKDTEKYANLLVLEEGIVKVNPTKLTLKRRLAEVELKEGDNIEKNLEPFTKENVLLKVKLRVNMGDPFFNIKKERIERLLGEKLAKLDIEPIGVNSVAASQQEGFDLLDLYVDFYNKEYGEKPPQDLKELLQDIIDRVSHEAPQT
ncbi:MAG: exonuclease SbcCD subunit D [Aquificaceae bacterium]